MFLYCCFVFCRRFDGCDERGDEVISAFEHYIHVACGLLDAATERGDAVKQGDCPREKPEQAEGKGADAVDEPLAGV